MQRTTIKAGTVLKLNCHSGLRAGIHDWMPYQVRHDRNTQKYMEKHLKLAFQFGVVVIALVIIWFGISWALVTGGGEGGLAYLNVSIGLFAVVGFPMLGIHLVWSISLLVISLRQIMGKSFLVQKKVFRLFLSSFIIEALICVYLISLISQ